MTWSDSTPKRGARFWTIRPRIPDGARPYVKLCPATEPEKVALRKAAAWHARREEMEKLHLDRGAERYRAHLHAAGIDRPELYKRTAARRPIRLHDTRATFVTISLANGRTDTWVKDRTGHRSSQMLENYRRAARTLAELELGPLAPLDQAIPELRGKAPGGELGQLGEGVAMAKTGWDALEGSIGGET